MTPDPTGPPPEPVIVARSGVDHCFGCGPHNDRGLRLRFHRFADGTVETRHRTHDDHCGLDTVVHGGIQATILDEVMGIAAQLGLPADGSDLSCVTVEMQLRYRRPVPMAAEVIARASLESADGDDLHVVGAIVAPDGEVLTEASSRWRQLRTL